MTRARDNPFAVSRVRAIRYRALDGEPREELLKRLAARFCELGNRAAIVGPEGHGKTTLLEDLVAQGSGPLDPTPYGGRVRWLSLRRETPLARATPEPTIREFVRSLGPQDLAVVDGFDLLAPFSRWRVRHVARGARGLLVASHVALASLPTLHECVTTVALLAAIVSDLAQGEQPSASALDTVFSRHDGNLRDALRTLYDHAADQISK